MYTRRSHERFVGPSRLGLPQNTCTFACACACTCNNTSCSLTAPTPTLTPAPVSVFSICVFILCLCCSVLFCSVLLVSGPLHGQPCQMLRVMARKCCCRKRIRNLILILPLLPLLSPRHCLCHCWTTAANRGTELGSRRGRDISTRGLQANK